jgi:hypothetical protein
VLTSPDGGGTARGDAGPKACENLCKRQVVCPNNGDTTLVGVVHAPTPARFGAADPIYNATVYVPNAPVQPFSPGVRCESCAGAISGSPVTATISGPDGHFVLKNVPTGDNIPLVIQVGRWRRQVTVPRVEKCAETKVPDEMTRLPRNKTEGDIPLTAIATGNADALECVLRKIGVDENEYTLPSDNGRIHIYKNNGSHLGDATPSGASLAGNIDTLRRYDMVILECEGGPQNKTGPERQNLVQYANSGGRMFVTHFEYTYLYQTMPFSGAATWNVGQPYPTVENAPLVGLIDQTFPKGMAFAQWLQLVGASMTPGQIQIFAPRHDVDGVVAPTQRWVYTQGPDTLQQFTFNTPVGDPEEKQCGRVLFSDFHVSDIKNISVQFPMACNDNPMTPQEKVLEFLLFDLASCVQPDSKGPYIP